MIKSKSSTLSKILGIIAFAVGCVTLICAIAAYISPGFFWVPAVFGLAFQFAYPLNAAFVLILAIRRKKLVFFLLIPFILGVTTFYDGFNFTGSKIVTPNPKSIKVMTFNVRLFDLYNWSHNLETRAKIFHVLNEEKPDIICFQEFYSQDDSIFNNADTLSSIMDLPYKHIQYTTTIKKIHHWGIATYSKYPIVNRGKMIFGNKKNPNTCIYSDLAIDGDTIRIYNTHLESIRFKKADYEYIENIKENDEEEKLTGGKKILARLKRAFEKRAAEADTLAEHISLSPYPTILCGDFNDTPASYSYKTITKNLVDAFKEGEAGFGNTYNGAFPAFRIDYILYSNTFNCYNYNVIRQNLSDHFSVSCYLEMKK